VAIDEKNNLGKENLIQRCLAWLGGGGGHNLYCDRSLKGRLAPAALEGAVQQITVKSSCRDT
jgi:hypothetical protein